MKVFLNSIGCRLNQSEIETMARQLLAAGHEIVTESVEADKVIINTCAVTSEAARDARSQTRRIHRDNPNAEIVLTGCYATIAPNELGKVQGAGRVVVNQQKAQLVQMLDPKARIELPVFDQEPVLREFLAGSMGANTRAFIKVQDGCDNKCTFCVTTVARGEGQSRHLGDVVAEIQALAAAGYQEAVLTGVHLGSYGHDFGNEAGLRDLVQAILQHTDIPRLRLSSLEPWDLAPDFFTLWHNPRLLPHLHMPLQSGSDKILKRMARRTSRASFRELAEAARSHILDLNLSTDVIVGFPGETEKDFADSLELVEAINFARLHVFSYSPRPGTAASQFPHQVNGKIKKERTRRMIELGKRLSHDFHQQFVSQTLNVLWESNVGADNGGLRWVGYTDNYIRVQANGPADMFNRITPTEIVEAAPDGVAGVVKSGKWGCFGRKGMTKFKVGDSVRVKSGVKDPDFNTEIGGWQGRIVDIVTAPENYADIAWDSQTLQQMPEELLDYCFREGYTIEGITLTLDELEPSKPRDKEKDVHNTLAEIYGRYGLEYQTDLESLVWSMADQFGLLEDEDDWDDEPIQTFDIDQFFADLQIDSAKEQKRIRSCFAKGLEVYYEHIYGYHKYGRKPEFLINERMGEPYIFGFGMVEVLRAKRGIKETTKLAICQYTLQTIVPEEEYGIPHGLIVLLSYLAHTGYLPLDVFRAVMQVTNLLRHWIWPWQIEEAIQLSDWLIAQNEMPPQEKLFWLWHLSMQFDPIVHLGKKVVNHWLDHPDLAADLKKELVQGWLDEVRTLGTPHAAWRLVMAQTTGDLVEAEKALQELGVSRKEIKEVKAIIEEEANRDVLSKLFSHDPLYNFSPEFRYLLTPNWLKRIAVLTLVKLGEDAWETAVLYLDSTRDYGAEAINLGVADIIAEYADTIPPEEIRELIEKGIQIPQVSTRKAFYRLSTQFYGTELLEKTAEDNAASIRKWGTKELKKLQG